MRWWLLALVLIACKGDKDSGPAEQPAPSAPARDAAPAPEPVADAAPPADLHDPGTPDVEVPVPVLEDDAP